MVVTDEDEDVSSYKIFTVGSASGSSDEEGDFRVTADTTSPDEGEYVDIKILARDDNGSLQTSYDGTVKFKISRRLSSSSSWTDITSSNTDNSSYRVYSASYNFSSSDDGEYERSNFIKFYDDNYDYKLRVYDEDNTDMYGEIIFYLKTSGGSSNSDSDATKFVGEFYPVAPTSSSFADLKLYVRDDDNDTVTDYTETVNFEIQKRTSPSATSRSKTTSCTLDEDDYKFTSSDDGYVKLDDLVKCTSK